MRWMKVYSLVLIVLSVVMVIVSFFMIDLLPLIYKVYTGSTISPDKIEKLILFGTKVSNELILYAALSFFTFVSFFFTRTVKEYFIVLSVVLLLHFVVVAEIGEYVIIKRFYQLFVMLPLLWIFFDFFKFKSETYEKKVTHGFLYLTLLCLVLPGLYLPPFFTGIPGWTVEIDKKEPFYIDGVFLVRDDGEEIRFSRAIVNPVNFVTRLNGYMLNSHPEKVEKLLTFYKQSYIKRYALLEKGYMPNERLFGKFAYPIHNPYGTFDYAKFPPSSIKEIKLSKKYYYWDKTFIKEEVLAREVW